MSTQAMKISDTATDTLAQKEPGGGYRIRRPSGGKSPEK